jgi:mannonate dehydratase
VQESFRWFGPADLVALPDIVQAGATGVVTALHDVAYGDVWTPEAIAERCRLIDEGSGGLLAWNVAESLPVHERIKLGEGDLETLYENYRLSMRHLAAAGVTTICYNFMPLLDWIRTDLAVVLPGGGRTVRFAIEKHAAFDCFMLQRPGAEADYSDDVLARAKAWFDASTEADRETLLSSIMAGLPGAYERYSVERLRPLIQRFGAVSPAQLRANLVRFLEAVCPTAEECGISLAIHPDDPPRPVFGLPRVVSTEADFAFLFGSVPSPANGMTLCSGSLGSGADNDVVAIATRFGDRIRFAHLRNVAKEADGSFQEAAHLGGDTDMVAVTAAILDAEARRRVAGGAAIPMRPDHGHELLGDIGRPFHPGYSMIGRLKGLAELRGVAAALSWRRANAGI